MLKHSERVDHAKILIIRGLALVREGCKQLVSLRATVINPLADTPILGKGHNPDLIPDKVKTLPKTKGIAQGARSTVTGEGKSNRASGTALSS